MNHTTDKPAQQGEALLPPPAPVTPLKENDNQASPGSSPDSDQEVDVWWGSYSGWTMLPSFLVCALLTALVVWLVRIFFHERHKDLEQLTVLGVGGGIWLGQLTRWGFRFFGFNYRLTSRRLFLDRGFLYPDRVQVELSSMDQVRVERNILENLVGVGRLHLLFAEPGRPYLVLEGVRAPQRVADLIREGIRKSINTPRAANEPGCELRSPLPGQ